MNTDKRSPATSSYALDTLGEIIDHEAKRDGVQLMVEPVYAGEPLNPGEHVYVEEGCAYRAIPGKSFGIVDPFLGSPLDEGDRFWFILFPHLTQKIQSTRTVWLHPSFPTEAESAEMDVEGEDMRREIEVAGMVVAANEAVTAATTPQEKEKAEELKKTAADAWIREFCRRTEGAPRFETLKACLTANACHEWDEEHFTVPGEEACCRLSDKFWEHVETLIGPVYPRAKFLVSDPELTCASLDPGNPE